MGLEAVLVCVGWMPPETVAQSVLGNPKEVYQYSLPEIACSYNNLSLSQAALNCSKSNASFRNHAIEGGC